MALLVWTTADPYVLWIQQRVPAKAMRLSGCLRRDPVAPERVFDGRDRLKMIRVDTAPDAALMVQRESFRNETDKRRVADAMSAVRDAVLISDTAVAFSNNAEPEPAPAHWLWNAPLKKSRPDIAVDFEPSALTNLDRAGRL